MTNLRASQRRNIELQHAPHFILNDFNVYILIVGLVHFRIFGTYTNCGPSGPNSLKHIRGWYLAFLINIRRRRKKIWKVKHKSYEMKSAGVKNVCMIKHPVEI
jgi:hypothetical protein